MLVLIGMGVLIKANALMIGLMMLYARAIAARRDSMGSTFPKSV